MSYPDDVTSGCAYRPEILDALAGHGLRPTASTAPARAKEFVNDLYCYELRRLRRALLAGSFPKADYAGHVVSLRRRYWLLSLPLERWTM